MTMTTVGELHTSNRADMWNASMQSHLPYLDTATGLFKEEFTRDRPCPVCGGANETALFVKEGGRYVRCTDCTMVYLNPVFTDEALTDYYRNNHVEQSVVVEADRAFYEGLYTQGLASAEKYTSKGWILDIGCSSGVFIDLAKSRGWKTSGLELNRQEAALARAKGHTVQERPIAEATFDKKFNVISLWDVFEHIADGGAQLDLMQANLTDDGVMLLQIPSADSLAARMLQEKCNMFDGLEHTNLYGVASLARLVESKGLEILNIESVISEIGVMNNHLAYDGLYTGASDNFETLMDLVDARTVLDKLLGYKLQVVIGRK
ncbi:MAG: methyltransferase domain-containing protein [Acidimicrobiales bacterium]